MTSYHVAVAPSADQDLAEIFEDIAFESPTPYEVSKAVAKVYASFELLSYLPFMGALVKDAFLAKQGFRALYIDRYIAFYVVDAAGQKVVIQRILYARRHYKHLFKEEQEHSRIP